LIKKKEKKSRLLRQKTYTRVHVDWYCRLFWCFFL